MVKGIFEKYEEITKKMILCLKEDKDADELMQERENILKELENSEYSKSEKLECYKALGLDVLDKKLEEIIKSEMLNAMEEIKNTQNRKAAYTSYTSNDRQRNLFARKV